MATWQELLEQYKTDKSAATKEVLRAKQVYEGEKAGYGEGFDQSDRAKQITTWANQVREAAGLDDSQYGVNVALPQAQSNYDALSTVANTPALLTKGAAGAIGGPTSGGTTTGVIGTPAAITGVTTGATAENKGTTREKLYTASNPIGGAVTNLTPSSTTSATTPTYQGPDIQGMINSLKQAQINASIANLGKAKTNALGAYQGAENTINQTAQSQRNVNSIASQKGALDFAKYLASRGLVNSGTAAQGEISRNVALQGAQSAVGTNESNQLAEVANKRAGIESGYQSDLAAAQSGAETNALQLAIQEAQRQDELNRNQAYQAAQLKLQEAGLTGAYNGQQTLAGKQLDTDIALSEAALTGMYKGNTTLAAQQQALDNEFRTGQFDWNKQQDLWSRGFQTGQLDYQKARDLVSDKRYDAEWKQNLDDIAWSKNENNPYVRAQVLQNEAQDLNIQAAQLNLDNLPEQIRLNLEQMQKEIAQIGVTPALTADEQEMQKLKIDAAKADLIQVQVQQYTNYIDSAFATPTVDEYGNKSGVSYDKAAILNYLSSLKDSYGVSEEILDSIAAIYGIT